MSNRMKKLAIGAGIILFIGYVGHATQGRLWAGVMILLLLVGLASSVIVGRISSTAPTWIRSLSNRLLRRPVWLGAAVLAAAFLCLSAMTPATPGGPGGPSAIRSARAADWRKPSVEPSAETSVETSPAQTQTRSAERGLALTPEKSAAKASVRAVAGHRPSRGWNAATYEGLYDVQGGYRFPDCSPFELRVATIVHREIHKNAKEPEKRALRRAAREVGLSAEVTQGIYGKATLKCDWRPSGDGR